MEGSGEPGEHGAAMEEKIGEGITRKLNAGPEPDPKVVEKLLLVTNPTQPDSMFRMYLDPSKENKWIHLPVKDVGV